MHNQSRRDNTTERPPRQKESGGVKTGQRIWSIIDRKQEGKQASLTTGDGVRSHVVLLPCIANIPWEKILYSGYNAINDMS
jgi:hypothetical protein